MDPVASARMHGPYCGESREITVDASVGQQDYIEDGPVGGQPIPCRMRVNADGHSSMDVHSEEAS